jgi:hypothetical protein
MYDVKRYRPAVLGALTLALVAPPTASGQTVASSFAELRQVLKPGQTVVVIDTSGQRTKGKVAELPAAPSSLVVLVPAPRTFPEGAIVEIRTTDSRRNGALIGASIGGGLALWDYLIDPSEPGNALITTVAVGLGTALGLGVDALIGRNKLLYRSRGQAARLKLLPITAAGGRRGVAFNVTFQIGRLE